MALFYNFSVNPFSHTWNKVSYTFKPGEVYEGIIVSDAGGSPLELNEILAGFFAGHFAEWLLNTPAMNVNFIFDENGKRQGTDGYPSKYNMTSIEMIKERAMTRPEVHVELPKFIDELPIIKKGKKVVEVAETPKAEPVDESVVEPKKKPGRPKKEEFDLE